MTFDINNFTRTGTYSTADPVPQIRGDLKNLVEAGKEFQIQYKKYQDRQDVAIMICIGGAIVMIFGGSFSSNFVLAGILVLIVGGIILGSNHNELNKYKNLDFHDRRDRHWLLSKLLDFWEKDLTAKTELKLALVLSPPTDPQKFVGSEPDPRKPDRTFSFYRDDWLKVKGKFADRTHFFLQITEIYRTCQWQNMRGKSRYREKPKGYRIGLKLKFDPEIYRRVPRRIKDAETPVKLPRGAILQSIRVTETRIQLKVKVEPRPAASGRQQLLYRTVVMMFLSAYQILNWVRIGSKNRRA